MSAAEGHGYRHCEWLDERPDGCVCYVQDDLWTKPADGCRVHVPRPIGQGSLPLPWDNPAVVEALRVLTEDRVREIERSLPTPAGPPTAAEILDRIAAFHRTVEQLTPTKALVCTPDGWAAIRERLTVRYPGMIPTQTPLLFGVQVYLDHDPLAEPWVLVDTEEYYARHRPPTEETSKP